MRLVFHLMGRCYSGQGLDGVTRAGGKRKNMKTNSDNCKLYRTLASASHTTGPGELRRFQGRLSQREEPSCDASWKSRSHGARAFYR